MLLCFGSTIICNNIFPISHKIFVVGGSFDVPRFATTLARCQHAVNVTHGMITDMAQCRLLIIKSMKWMVRILHRCLAKLNSSQLPPGLRPLLLYLPIESATTGMEGKNQHHGLPRRPENPTIQMLVHC